jgi:hypothetical protein
MKFSKNMNSHFTVTPHELTLHSKPSGTFLKMWDQMKTTSFCSLSLTSRANKIIMRDDKFV